MKTSNQQKGQSTIEYVLLLAVVMLLVSIVLRSPLFADLLGKDSSFFKALKDRMEYSYRFTHLDSEEDAGLKDIRAPESHDSFSKGGRSRFIGATDEYTGGGP